MVKRCTKRLYIISGDKKGIHYKWYLMMLGHAIYNPLVYKISWKSAIFLPKKCWKFPKLDPFGFIKMADQFQKHAFPIQILNLNKWKWWVKFEIRKCVQIDPLWSFCLIMWPQKIQRIQLEGDSFKGFFPSSSPLYLF